MLLFGSTIIVARLLTPSDYAIAGLAGTVMRFFGMLTVHGFGYSLVQRKKLEEAACHSTFWFLNCIGIVICIVAFILTPWIANFYKSEELKVVMWVLTFGLFFGIAGSVPSAILQRQMRFREINLLAIAGSLLTSVLGIGIALGGYGYWALIMPGIGASLLTSIFSFAIADYKPKLSFQWCQIKPSLNFGFSITMSNFISFLASNLDYLIMSRFWKKSDFGMYYFAFENASRPFQTITMQLSGVLLPTFSKLQSDVIRLKKGFLKATHDLCLIVYPVHVLLIGLADILIPLVFGEQWRPAVPIFQIFFINILFAAPATFVSDLISAMNKPHLGIYFNLIRLLITLPVLLFFGFNGYNVVWTAVILVVIWITLMPIWLRYANRLMNMSWKESWNNLKYLFIISMTMSITLASCRVIAYTNDWHIWSTLSISIAFPSIIFLLMARKQIVSLSTQVRSVLIRKI